jgi:hypothetical protein
MVQKISLQLESFGSQKISGQLEIKRNVCLWWRGALRV